MGRSVYDILLYFYDGQQGNALVLNLWLFCGRAGVASFSHPIRKEREDGLDRCFLVGYLSYLSFPLFFPPFLSIRRRCYDIYFSGAHASHCCG
jgi:hypothetical protein